jgi:hypothetical protein
VRHPGTVTICLGSKLTLHNTAAPPLASCSVVHTHTVCGSPASCHRPAGHKHHRGSSSLTCHTAAASAAAAMNKNSPQQHTPLADDSKQACSLVWVAGGLVPWQHLPQCPAHHPCCPHDQRAQLQIREPHTQHQLPPYLQTYSSTATA